MKTLCCLLLVIAVAAGCASARMVQQDDLSVYVQKVRVLSSEARPPRPSLESLEQRSRVLGAAITRASSLPDAVNLCLAGDAYWRAGVFDQAFEYYSRASKVDPQHAPAWNGMARIWRDWGFPHLGLGDAHRAVSYAPASPAAHNTLGTILQTLGRGRQAREQFDLALRLDPAAAYALNNLCYSWTAEGNPTAALAACNQALRAAPSLWAVQANRSAVLGQRLATLSPAGEDDHARH